MAVKAYCSQLTIHFGTATTTGALYPIRATPKTPKFKLATPDGKPTQQVYRDEDGKIWDKEVLKRGIVNPETKELELVADQSVEKAKESQLPLNTLVLTAHDKVEVDRYIFPSTNQAYIFKPLIKKGDKVVKDPVNVQWYDFLNVLLRDADIALLGMCNLQNHEGLFRLGMYQGYITVQKQLHPEELNQYDEYTPGLGEDERREAVRVSQRAFKGFDAEEYVNQIAERLCAIQPGAEVDPEAKPVAPVPSELNMMEALQSFGV